MWTPRIEQLADCLAALALWQHDDAAFQLHPGDLGWHWRFGAARTAAVTRVWSDGNLIYAVALLDGPTLRLAIAPEQAHHAAVAGSIVADVLATDVASVEAPRGCAVRDLLAASGWVQGEAWTPLVRDLTAPVAAPGLEVSVTGTHDVDARVEVQLASFEQSTFTAAAWREMASGPAYVNARCVVGRDASGVAVAAATVWSAGVGRPGVIEPLGVHRDHRGKGHGTAITLAAASALRELGASRAIVATPSANVAAVATYVAAGFRRLDHVHDLERPAQA